jgi:3-methyl-2-oxobutanoate hydroxymethyltransferase
VLESLPAELGGWISRHLEIPTIGIGAGAECDGQVLVSHDVLGLFERFTPRFVKQYASFYTEMVDAFTAYRQDIQEHAFPTSAHSVQMPAEEWADFLEAIQAG